MLLLPYGIASAAHVIDLNNYLYVHANKPGTYYLKDKYGTKTINADNTNNQGVNIALSFSQRHGVQGERLYVKYPNGSTQDITSDVVMLDQQAKSMEIVLVKTTSTETYVQLYEQLVKHDLAPDNLAYHYNQTPPTSIGDDPNSGTDPGSGGVKHKFFYMDTRNEYRFDFSNVPKDASTVKLTFDSPSGNSYDREWPVGEVLGTLYLTCNGTYTVSFHDNLGLGIGTVGDLKTVKITNGSCNSYPETKPKNDLNAKVEKSTCDPNGGSGSKLKWDAKPGSNYDIYKDGQKVGNVSGGEFPISEGGSYTVVERDPSGNPTGNESDVNTPYIDEKGGNNNGNSEIINGICKCIEDLKPVLEEIRDNTAPIHDDLVTIHKDLVQIDGTLNEIVRQLKPTKEYSIPSVVEKPDYFKPKPIADKPFYDNNTYFTDQGDAPAPPSMPVAPDPKNWKYNGVEIKQGESFKVDPEMKQDPNMQQDAELKQDVNLEQDPFLNQEQPLEIQEQNYPLRWKSSDFVR